MEDPATQLWCYSIVYCEIKARESLYARQAVACSIREGVLIEFSAYIVTLREFIREGRRADVHGNDEKTFDACAYWRNMHEKSQEVEQQVRAENLVLRAEILVLEQKLESSSGTSGQMTQSTGTPQPKRKRGDSATKTETRDRPVKKAKSTEAISVSQSNVVQPIVIRGNLDLDEHAIDCKQLSQILPTQQSLILY